jgi:O-antigen/teichoic acid export membrane protein
LPGDPAPPEPNGTTADLDLDSGGGVEVDVPVRRFALGRDTLWASVNEVGRMVSALLVFLVVAKELGPDGYGVFAGAQALAAITATLSSAAVVLFLLQEAVREATPLDEALPIALGLGLAAAALVVGFTLAIGPFLLPSAPIVVILGLAIVEAGGSAMVAMAAGALQAGLGYASSARVWTVYLFGRTLVVAVLLVIDEVTLTNVVVIQAGFSLLCGAGGLRYALRRLDLRLRIARPHRVHVRRTLSYSATTGAFSLNEDGDKTLMVRLATEFDAGIYAAAYRVLAPVLAPVRALVTASHTRFLADDPSIKGQHQRRAVQYTLAAGAYGVLATAALVLLADVVMDVLGSGFDAAATVLRWVAPLVLLRTLGLFPFNALLGLRKNLLRTVIVGTSAAVNLGSNLVLIPRYSWKGAAAATLASETVFLAFTWIAVVVHQRRRDAQIDAEAVVA